jgi:ketosteroid isomerase-like protein
LKKQLMIAVAALAMFAFAGCSGQGNNGGQAHNRPRAKEDETRQAFEKVMSAFARRDVASLNDMMSSTAIFIDPPAGPGVFSWTEAKPILEKSFSTSVPFQLTNESGYRIGVDHELGWIATVYHIRVPNDKGSFTQSDGGMSMLFQKTDAGYKVLMLHASRFAPAGTKPTSAEEAGKTPSAKKK